MIPPVHPLQRRDIFLFFLAGCSDSEDRSIGMRMRFAAVRVFGQIHESDVSVKCKCSSCPGREEHSHMIKRLSRSRFCLIIPGDTQASRRLTEVILMGCIPVFVGPPFHALPLGRYVDYNSIGYFFHVKHANWDFQSADAQNVDMWRLDSPVTMIDVDFLIDIYTFLRDVRDCEIKRKQRALRDNRRFFVYEGTLKEEKPQAVDVVLHSLCTKIRSRQDGDSPS